MTEATTHIEDKVDVPDHTGPDGSDSEGEGEGGSTPASKKKKKKSKPKKKKKNNFTENGGGVPPEIVPEVEAFETWAAELAPGVRTFTLDAYNVISERERERLDLFRTPACIAARLRTPRLVLRQVEVSDTTAIRRIKMEPVVQRTQLYGSPSTMDIKPSFTRRYVAASIPVLEREGCWRNEFVFAITAKEGSGITQAPAGNVRISNRIANVDGYLGNIALSLEGRGMEPIPGETWKHPTFAQCSEGGLTGKMFYELHPQLWGQGIVTEAFGEVLRFAMEEVGCTSVSADPTVGNEASIRLCTKFGMRFVRECTDHAKPQLFHAITREEWFKKAGKEVKGGWEGKITCRWCVDPRRRAAIECKCGWARYCSRECQRADWVWRGGHQAECEG